ncbi:hypothetical protein FDECE_16447 [Fusarium decemcellulare]|nr:hypothetical protein FDECE_16447 [Fusarium decemcellulare]
MRYAALREVEREAVSHVCCMYIRDWGDSDDDNNDDGGAEMGAGREIAQTQPSTQEQKARASKREMRRRQPTPQLWGGMDVHKRADGTVKSGGQSKWPGGAEGGTASQESTHESEPWEELVRLMGAGRWVMVGWPLVCVVEAPWPVAWSPGPLRRRVARDGTDKELHRL